MITLSGLQISLIIYFIFVNRFKPIYSFLNQFTMGNPPKRNNYYVENDEDSKGKKLKQIQIHFLIKNLKNLKIQVK